MSGLSSLTTPVTFRAPNEMREDIEAIAARKGINRSALILQWVAEAYSREVEVRGVINSESGAVKVLPSSQKK